MSEQSDPRHAAGAPWWVTIFTPISRFLLARTHSDGLQRAHHHPRPDERPAAHHAHRDHPRLRQALGLVPLGRGQLGAQSARRRPRDHHRPRPEGRGPATELDPTRAQSRSFATRSALSREPSRSVAGSSGSSMGSISTSRRKRLRVGESSNSTHRGTPQLRRHTAGWRGRALRPPLLRSRTFRCARCGARSRLRRHRPAVRFSSGRACRVQPRRRASQSRARIVFASRSSPRSAAATASRHGIFSRRRCSSSSGAEALAVRWSQIRGEIEVHQLRGKTGSREEARDEPP